MTVPSQFVSSLTWPEPSPKECFTERRRRFLAAFQGPAVLSSGVPRVRNFAANQYPFRAESHFLYFIGCSLPEALLCFNKGKAQLFLEEPLPDERMWHGPTPSFEQLSEALGLEVRPLDEFKAPAKSAALASADMDSQLWLEDYLGRSASSDGLSGLPVDAQLAEALVQLRLCHDEFGIAQLRQAAAVTCDAHRAGMRATRPGSREAVPRAAIEAVMTRAGMQPAYGSIVTTSGNVLHHKTSAQVMNSGDLLLVDAGAETPEGWAADVTRTWPVSGRFDGFQADVYDVVLAAQADAIAMLKPGVRYLDVHRTAALCLVNGLIQIGLLRGNAADLLARGVGAAFFPHGVGHLLGLDVHDMELLGDRAGYGPGRTRGAAPAERYLRLDRDLAAGMLVTIEPGFYNLDGLLDDATTIEAVRDTVVPARLDDLRRFRGIRIEDDVLITHTGCEVLTRHAPKDRAELEALIGADA